MNDIREEFRDALLRELVFTDPPGSPPSWRKRKVIQITPVNRYSYRERTSYQFSISSETIRAVMQWLLAEHQRREGGIVGFEGYGIQEYLANWPVNIWNREFDITLPVARLPITPNANLIAEISYAKSCP